MLRDAGIKVLTNCLEAETSKLVKGHIKDFFWSPFCSAQTYDEFRWKDCTIKWSFKVDHV